MTANELNVLSNEAYNTAVAHGFHEKPHTTCYFLGLITSEIGEAINADRAGGTLPTRKDMAQIESFLDTGDIPLFRYNFERCVKDTALDELADIIIRLFDMVGTRKVKFYDSYIPWCHMTEKRRKVFLRNNMDYISRKDLPDILYRFIIDRLLDINLNDLDPQNYLDAFTTIEYIAETFYKSDIWPYVRLKMSYNKLRAKYNGKKY